MHREFRRITLATCLLSLLAATSHLRAEVEYTGSTSINGGMTTIGFDGPGGLILSDSGSYTTFGGNITFGTSPTKTGDLTMSGSIAFNFLGAGSSSLNEAGKNGGTLDFRYGTLSVTGGSLSFNGSNGANSDTSSGTAGRGGHGGNFNYSDSGNGTLNAPLSADGGDAGFQYNGNGNTGIGATGGRGGAISVSNGTLLLGGTLSLDGGTGGGSNYNTGGVGGAGGTLQITNATVTLEADYGSTGGTGGSGGGSYQGGSGGAGGQININSGGTFNYFQNAINLSGGSGGSGSVNGAAGANGSLTIAGGTLNSSTPAFLNSNLTGDLTFTSGTIHFNGTGGTISSGGRLANALSSGLGTNQILEFDEAVTINTDLTLNDGGTLVLHDGATLAAGSTLTLNSGTALSFYLGVADTSTLTLLGNAALVGPASGQVTLNFFDAGDFALGTYELFDASYESATLTHFDASKFTVGTGIGDYHFTFSMNGDILQVTASAVPEPSTYALLLGLATLGLAAGRRRTSGHNQPSM